MPSKSFEIMPLDVIRNDPENKMVHLVSINNVDTPVDVESDGRLQEAPVTNGVYKPSNENCAVNIGWPPPPVQDRVTENNSGLKKSTSRSNLRSKRMPVNVEWKNVTLKTKKDVLILKHLSGCVMSGELTAIMGPSGAGKSSLLNVLTGFTRQKASGKILVNGASRDMRVFRKLSCYILQDDHLLPRLTVREIVTIAASLKIPTKVTKKEKQQAVEDCLESLGLASHGHQRANVLSGGQRKRLCIAQELVSNPPLIFLDEPTSGLDSSSCLQCIQLLKSLAREGRTVVCTIHQPSSKIFEIFDKLYMLAEGKCIYRGSTQNLVPFLADQGLTCPQYHNPTDYVTEVAMGVYGDWNHRLMKANNDLDDISTSSSQVDLLEVESIQEETFQSSLVSLLRKKIKVKTEAKEDKLLETPYIGYATSSIHQFRVLFCRSILCILREPMNTQLKLIGNVVMGLLLGTLYWGIGNDGSKVFNNAGLIFCIIIFLIFTAKMPTILTFPTERIIFEREHMNSWYNTRMYFLATSVADIPFQILFPIINCSIVYWMSGQPSDANRFCLFLLSAVLLSLVSQSIGQLIGAGSDVQKGVYLASVTSIPTLLFCGYFITMSTIPSYLQWLSYCSYARYTFQSIMLGLYSMDRPLLHCNKTSCPFVDPKEILEELDMQGDIVIDYSALLGFFLFFRLATYLVLKFRTMNIQ